MSSYYLNTNNEPNNFELVANYVLEKKETVWFIKLYYTCALNQELKIGFIEPIRKRRRSCS